MGPVATKKMQNWSFPFVDLERTAKKSNVIYNPSAQPCIEIVSEYFNCFSINVLVVHHYRHFENFTKHPSVFLTRARVSVHYFRISEFGPCIVTVCSGVIHDTISNVRFLRANSCAVFL